MMAGRYLCRGRWCGGRVLCEIYALLLPDFVGRAARLAIQRMFFESIFPKKDITANRLERLSIPSAGPNVISRF